MTKYSRIIEYSDGHISNFEEDATSVPEALDREIDFILRQNYRRKIALIRIKELYAA